MAAPNDYSYDVFISYTRSDVITPWVINYFHKHLNNWLTQELGVREARIFVDQNEIVEGEHWPIAIRDSLLASRCLVPVLSGRYFFRSWCLSEWKNFVRREEMLGLNATRESLIVPVIYHDGEWFLDEVNNYQKFDFKDCRTTSSCFEKHEKFFVFEDKVQRLAKILAAMVHRAPQFDPSWPKVVFNPDEPTVPMESLA